MYAQNYAQKMTKYAKIRKIKLYISDILNLIETYSLPNNFLDCSKKTRKYIKIRALIITK